MEEWRTVRFGDVIRKVNENVDHLTSDLERYVSGRHIETDVPILRKWGMINQGYLGPAFNKKFLPGQVLYVSRRTYLRKMTVANFEGICSNTTFVLESINPEVLLQKFVPVIMSSKPFQEFSELNSKGSVTPYINFSDLAEFEFKLPPLEVQKKIILLHQEIFELIEKHSHSRYLLGLLPDIFYRQETSGASMKKLSEICEITSGSTFPVSMQGNINGDIPFYKVSDMTTVGNEKFMIKAVNQITIEQANLIGARIHPPGSVIFAKVGAALHKNRKRILSKHSFVDNNIMVLVPDHEKILPEMLLYAMRSVNLSKYAQTSTLPSVNNKIAGKIMIAHESMHKQKKIVTNIKQLENFQKGTKPVVELLGELMKAISHQIFPEVE